MEAFRSEEETFGALSPGMSVFAVTRGQFSMIDVVQLLVRAIGGGEISVWTWTIAHWEDGAGARTEVGGQHTRAVIGW